MNAVKLAAEFLGTFLLVFMVFASGGNPVVLGLTLTFIVLMIGNISGGLVNPAITAAMYFSGSLSFNELITYMIIQLTAGVSAIAGYNYIMH
jgi:aquaporin Z